MLSGVPFVGVRRGLRLESVHDVAACACDVDGNVLLALGTIYEPVFLRSAAKPFIAAAGVRAGVVERFGFDDRELAVMSASHNGEPYHVDAVRAILAKDRRNGRRFAMRRACPLVSACRAGSGRRRRASDGAAQ